MKLYIAGPMFIESEIMYASLLARELRARDFSVYLPSEDKEINDKRRVDITGEKIYQKDIAAIEDSNILVCQFSECSGTMWESGYMDCLSKHVDPSKYLGVIAIVTDIRLATPPDLGKSGVDNQTMYLNQFAVGAIKSSLGIYTERITLYNKLESIRATR